MRINSLAYSKTIKALAQLDFIIREAAGTFFESKIRECRGRLVVEAACRWERAIQKTKPGKPTVFIVEDDVAYAKRNWM